MDRVSLDLENCYGIQKLKHSFDFTARNAYAIYAPNGCMKTSLARTFADLSKGQQPKDLIHPERTTKCLILDENKQPLSQDDLVVLEPFRKPLEKNPSAILLVNSALREEYDKLNAETDQAKEALVKALRKQSKCKEVESELSKAFTFKNDDFFTALGYVHKAIHADSETPYADLPYDAVFDDRVLAFLTQPDVKVALDDYVQRYNELISKSVYFRKGTFEYYQASTIAKSLEEQGFFKAKHFVTLNGTDKIEITSRAQLEKIITDEREKITTDPDLRKRFDAIDEGLIKNQAIKAFRGYLLNNEAILPKMVENINNFKQQVWQSYLKKNLALYDDLMGKHDTAVEKSLHILEEAKKESPHWEGVIRTFNERFSVPFKLGIQNRDAVVVGTAKEPILEFTFEDLGGPTPVTKEVLLSALSQGETKALYILDILFDIQVRQSRNQETLFIIDDIADSFDYKNKYAIIQYLMDLSEKPEFKMLLLTHNFDFFRTVCSRFVNHEGSYMACRTNTEIVLAQPEGIQNVFINVWKKKFFTDIQPRLASISFMRNLIEYTKGKDHADYVILTSLLHWKSTTSTIKQSELDRIYTDLFQATTPPASWVSPNELVFDSINAEAKACLGGVSGVNFAHKVVLAIAIRLAAEKFMFAKLADPTLTFNKSQTSGLFEKFKSACPGEAKQIKVLQRVLLMTPENIHLNAFMYEPIVDMSDDHLKRLYNDVTALT